MVSEKPTSVPVDTSRDLSFEKTSILIEKVRKVMSPEEINVLPNESKGYISAIVAKALGHVDDFHYELADLVRTTYLQKVTGERFIRDPIKDGVLFVDEAGELVTLMGAQIASVPPDAPLSEQAQVVQEYDKAFVWTGLQAEQEFSPEDKPIGEPALPSPEILARRPKRTKITPQMRIQMLFRAIGETADNHGHQIAYPERGREIDALLKYALKNIDLVQDEVADTIAFLYHYSPVENRFIQGPDEQGTLFVDGDGNIVLLNGAEILVSRRDHTQYIASYESYTVLSGDKKGMEFSGEDRPLPVPKKPRQFRVLAKK